MTTLKEEKDTDQFLKKEAQLQFNTVAIAIDKMQIEDGVAPTVRSCVVRFYHRVEKYLDSAACDFSSYSGEYSYSINTTSTNSTSQTDQFDGNQLQIYYENFIRKHCKNKNKDIFRRQISDVLYYFALIHSSNEQLRLTALEAHEDLVRLESERENADSILQRTWYLIAARKVDDGHSMAQRDIAISEMRAYRFCLIKDDSVKSNYLAHLERLARFFNADVDKVYVAAKEKIFFNSALKIMNDLVNVISGIRENVITVDSLGVKVNLSSYVDVIDKYKKRLRAYMRYIREGRLILGDDATLAQLFLWLGKLVNFFKESLTVTSPEKLDKLFATNINFPGALVQRKYSSDIAAMPTLWRKQSVVKLPEVKSLSKNRSSCPLPTSNKPVVKKRSASVPLPSFSSIKKKNKIKPKWHSGKHFPYSILSIFSSKTSGGKSLPKITTTSKKSGVRL